MIETTEEADGFKRHVCTVCGLRSGRTRAGAEQFFHKCARRIVPDDGIPCSYRGEAVEQVKCGCDGVQYTWRCNNPAIEGGLSILRNLPKMPAEYKSWPTCNKCDLRRAAE